MGSISTIWAVVFLEGKIERDGNLISQVYHKVQASIACGQTVFVCSSYIWICYPSPPHSPPPISRVTWNSLKNVVTPAGLLENSHIRPLKLKVAASIISQRLTTNHIKHDTHVHCLAPNVFFLHIHSDRPNTIVWLYTVLWKSISTLTDLFFFALLSQLHVRVKQILISGKHDLSKFKIQVSADDFII